MGLRLGYRLLPSLPFQTNHLDAIDIITYLAKEVMFLVALVCLFVYLRSLSLPRLYIFTVGNMGVMIFLCQGGLHSLSASSFVFFSLS